MRSEPAGSGRFRSERVAVRVDQNLAAADMVGLADEPVLLHPLDEARCAVVADAELALEIGGRGLLAFGDDLDGFAVELRLGVILVRRLAVEQVTTVFRLLGDSLDIFGDTLPPPML